MNYSISPMQKILFKVVYGKIEPKTTWIKSNSPDLRLTHYQTTKNSTFILTEIQKLVDELVEKIEEIERVIAIATYFPDIHWIDFKIKLKEDTELSDETWDTVQDIVINCEWKLIDDSAEGWYFHPQIVDRFYLLRNKKIADSQRMF